MRVQLHENIYLTSDAFNIILSEHKGYSEDKEGVKKDKWNHLSFHNTIELALTAYKNDFIRESKVQSIEGLSKKITKLNEIMAEINVKLGGL